MESQRAQLKVVHHQSAKWPPRFYFEVCNFCVEERTLCINALFFLGLGYNKSAYKQIQAVTFVSLSEGKIWPAVLAQVWTEIRKLVAPSLVTDGLMARERC